VASTTGSHAVVGSLNQAKLERMMTSHNRIDDTILNTSKPILSTKTPGQDTRTGFHHQIRARQRQHQKTLSILSDEDISVVHIRECLTTAPIDLQNPEQELTNWLAEQYTLVGGKWK
jgi:secreted trypsin-like serine protease